MMEGLQRKKEGFQGMSADSSQFVPLSESLCRAPPMMPLSSASGSGFA